MMLKNILLLVKGSEDCLKAAQMAIFLAQKAEANIIALNVISPQAIAVLQASFNLSESEAYVELSEDGWKYLYDIEDRAKKWGVRIFLEQIEGRLEQTILDYAKAHNADLIVAGRETNRFRNVQFKHNIITTLLHLTDIPVLLV